MQLGAAIFAVRLRWTCVFSSAEPASARSSLEGTDRRVGENNFFQFIGHTPAMLQNYFARVDSA
jgi:hypothetical protein